MATICEHGHSVAGQATAVWPHLSQESECADTRPHEVREVVVIDKGGSRHDIRRVSVHSNSGSSNESTKAEKSKSNEIHYHAAEKYVRASRKDHFEMPLYKLHELSRRVLACRASPGDLILRVASLACGAELL